MIKLNLNHPIVCPAMTALSALQTAGAVEFGFALSGGVVRDSMFAPSSGTFADHDIVIFGINEDYIEGTIGSICAALHNYGYDHVGSHGGNEEGNPYEDTDDRLWGVEQFTHDVYPKLDILLHPGRATLASTVTSHDFNINHVAAVVDDPDQPEVYTGYYFGETHTPRDLFAGEPPVLALPLLKQTADDITVERAEKMVRIAEACGWMIPHELQGFRKE